jgi:hypothetical protein
VRFAADTVNSYAVSDCNGSLTSSGTRDAVATTA